ncbi:hypothetical protein WJX84_005041 [Apatococcus fuscideae]|uniref:Uncharacterized protein n=1 Tax=Apatococcus fuscideae TaxID=2026836 RepID=A0AAW1STB1_9CHLO
MRNSKKKRQLERRRHRTRHQEPSDLQSATDQLASNNLTAAPNSRPIPSTWGGDACWRSRSPESGRWVVMPMQHAAAKGNMQLLRLLCKHPPYPGASTRRSASGWAPLHWAAFNANAKAAGVLMEGSSHGRASAMADQNGDTPVHIAAALGHADVLA